MKAPVEIKSGRLLHPKIARAARAYTGLTHNELAVAAGVAARTIYKLEKDGSVTHESFGKITKALQERGVGLLRDDKGNTTGLTFHQQGQ
ncbi:helix-turn-helix domain-containing protein [Rhizobium rhododendri]|uniref:Transcriptional regulator n=1 Tax=Rhizobium rhododendri TaxID=2506430 RepID=A0ABY8ILI5_9HYPH|nr:hypothetical protein [Rhizobium rhododendri]WFS23915.1 hypothetical protein PR018_05290 [Rhizobium rhododendri]